MSERLSSDALGAMLDQDREALKQLDEQLVELSDAEPGAENQAHARSLATFNRTIIRDCEKQMSAMEDIPDPTAEELKVMRKLNDLINLGDHYVHKSNLLCDTLGIPNDRVDDFAIPEPAPVVTKPALSGAKRTKSASEPLILSSSEWSSVPPLAVPIPKLVMPEMPRSAPATPPPAGSHQAAAVPPVQGTPVSDPSKAQPPSSTNLAKVKGKAGQAQTPQPAPSPSGQQTAQTEPQAEAQTYVPGSDRHGLYIVLGLDPQGQYETPRIKKAHQKKQMAMHPDRNRDDPEASEKFFFLQQAFEVLGNDERRQAYDERGELPQGFVHPEKASEPNVTGATSGMAGLKVKLLQK